MTKIQQLSLVTAASLSLSLLSMGEAFAFSFTKIADTSSSFAGLRVAAAINDSGTIAFSGDLNTLNAAVFTGSGGALTNIVTLPPKPAPGFAYPDAYAIDINNSGTVLFQTIDIGATIPSIGFYTGSGGTPTFVGGNGSRFSSFGASAINNNGSIAFFEVSPASLGRVGITNKGGVNRGDTFQSYYFVNLFGGSDLNNNDILAFRGILSNEPPDVPSTSLIDGIFTRKSDGTITSIATTNSDDFNFSVFSLPTINDSGVVAFGKAPGSGSRRDNLSNDTIFTSNGTSLTTIADTSGLFQALGNPAINNSGTVAFLGQLDTGVTGIFTGADPIADKVIAIGDTLFGSRVTSLYFSNKGLNNSGQLAFVAGLENGISGVFRADPQPPVQSVPEPSSVLGLLAVGVFGAGSLLKRKQNLERRSINGRGNLLTFAPTVVAPTGVRGRHRGAAPKENQCFWDY